MREARTLRAFLFPGLAPSSRPPACSLQKNRSETRPQTAAAVFPTPMSWLPEPLRSLCITSCQLCITFACNSKVTGPDVLKMNFLADPWKMKKLRTQLLFLHCAAALSRLAAPPADRDLFVAQRELPSLIPANVSVAKPPRLPRDVYRNNAF